MRGYEVVNDYILGINAQRKRVAGVAAPALDGRYMGGQPTGRRNDMVIIHPTHSFSQAKTHSDIITNDVSECAQTAPIKGDSK